MKLVLPALLALAAPAVGQQATPPSPAAAPAPVPADLVRVVLTTAEGPITLELDRGRAPATTANFLRYVDAKRFDGVAFYRAMKLGQGYGLVQAGLRNDPKKLFPPVRHEPTTQTGIRHEDGVISMARDKPGTATADFFIAVGALPSLDADPSKPGDDLGFAAFGRVVDGMDVVRRILLAPTSPTQGQGVMRGQMLSPTIRIVRARRTKP